ncbi:hypothetical protein DFH06DRAFT_561236 [Mycena polygramma]|nr:hypothetical protein DFH06DRAFT_561236 [Mycena polygramma]
MTTETLGRTAGLSSAIARMISSRHGSSKRQRKRNKSRSERKLSKARTPTSEGSKASTSRASAAISTRSLRSRTAVPGDYDTEREYDSISRTPANRKKRRLSRTPVLAADDDSPAAPSPTKKRRLASDHAREKSTGLHRGVSTSRAPSDEVVHPKRNGTSATSRRETSTKAVSRQLTAVSSDEDAEPVAQSKRNGKVVTRETSTKAVSRQLTAVSSDEDMEPAVQFKRNGKAATSTGSRRETSTKAVSRQLTAVSSDEDMEPVVPSKGKGKAVDREKPSSSRSKVVSRTHTAAPSDEDVEPGVLSKGKGKPLDREKNTSSRSKDVPSDEVVQSKGKGKAIDRSAPIPKPSAAPPKNTSFLQRHLDKHLLRGYKPTNGPSMGLFSVGTSYSQSQTGRSADVLSPRGQARLQQFDAEFAAPTQESRVREKSKSPLYTQKTQTPLFFPASSEDPDSEPSRPHSPSTSHSHSPSPSPGPSPRRLAASPVVSDYDVPPPVSRPRSRSRRSADDSYRVGDVPETQSTPEPPSPRAKKSSIKAAMKARSPKKPISAIPPPPFVRGAALGEVDPGDEGDAEAEESNSNIEQFSSPEKGKRRVVQPRRVVGDEDEEEEDELEEDEAVHARVVARGVAMAEASRAAERARKAEYESVWKAKAKRTSLSEIVEQKTQEAGVSMSTRTATDGPMSSPLTRSRPPAVRQEEEENTQDVMAFYQAGGNRDAGEGRSDPGRMANGHGAGHPPDGENARSDTGSQAGGDEDPAAPMANGDGHRSDGEDMSVADNRSEGRDTDADGDYDIDLAERSAWNEEHASQQRLDDPGNDDDLGNDFMQEDSDADNLMYPPSPSRMDEGLPSPLEDGEIAQNGVQKAPSEAQAERLPLLVYRAAQPRPQPASAAPAPEPPVVNGLPRSRSASARPRKPADDTDLELPPTASTRQNTPDAQSVPLEAATSPRHLDAAMSLLNAKSDENLRLESLLGDERAMVVAERAKNVVLQERVKTLESQASASTGDRDLAERLKAMEELLAVERAAAEAARQQTAALERERDSAPQGDTDLADRLKATEELLATERAAAEAALQRAAAVERERDTARRELAGAEQQRDLFQEYYRKASGFAEEKSSENKDLEKRVRIAEEQTREGLATIKATFDLRESTLRSETRDWRNQANFLREQAIRTNDDDLRRRAAEHPELVAQNASLVDELDRLIEEVESLKARLPPVDELLAKNAGLVEEVDRLMEEAESLKERPPATEHPELLAKNAGLVEDVERLGEEVECLKGHLNERIEVHKDDLRFKQERIDGLEQQLDDVNVEVERLKAETLVGAGTHVFRCGWRGEDNVACPAFCLTQIDLESHASMHVTKALFDPSLSYGSQ